MSRDAENLQRWMRESAGTEKDKPAPEPVVT